ncbi:glycoside hydrolase family 30 protein [Acidomyces richmondensis BFW]|nr:glycoside hydrolase family 30 protein [Acidomyces richmondensis BFW]
MVKLNAHCAIAIAGPLLTAASTVTVNSQPKQTLTSFGASGAWWPNDLIHFPISKQKELGHFLFSEDGLHLSSYRYNMGGDGGNDTQQVTTNGSRVESFLLRNGTYDWNRDHAGVTFLQMAQQYAVPYITFFINAAPSHIATNGAACGWNMTANKIPEFANYIQTVLGHWLQNGIDIKYISPMNEPDNNRADCGQEGMAVAPELRAPVVTAVRSALNENTTAAKVDIIADETSQITTQAYPEYPIWLPGAAPCMSNIAVHNYDYPTDEALAIYYQEVQSLTGSHTPPVKFTETCCSTNAGHGSSVFGAQYDPTMANALIVARYVWQFLTIVQAQSFDWWTAVADLPCSPKIGGQMCATGINQTAGYNSGLVYIDGNYNDTHDYNLYYTKRAFMMKHFTLHRPGSVRYDVQQDQLPFGVNAIASKHVDASPSGYESWGRPVWNVMFMNNQSHEYDLTLMAPDQASRLAHVWQTTNEDDWCEVSHLAREDDGHISFELPAQSFWTLQFS